MNTKISTLIGTIVIVLAIASTAILIYWDVSNETYLAIIRALSGR